MEFLDPKKQRAHTVRILVGYVLIGIALLLATTLLIYQAHGFSYKNGQVIQNGLIFLSTTPGGAEIHANGQLTKSKTNTSLKVPAGQYIFELRRAGYRKWQRAINVEGDVVVRFDYPFLVPEKLVSTTVKKYDVRPDVTLQSPDKHWALVPRPEVFGSFDQFDLGDPAKAQPAVRISEDLLADAAGAHKWELGEWASDSRHVLLKHLYGPDFKQSEYILLDRQDPAKTVNVTQALSTTGAAAISLRGQAYDQYYVFDANTGNLFTASLKKPSLQVYLQNVLAFKAHGEDDVLYATAHDPPTGKVFIRHKRGDKIHTLKSVPAGTTYLLDLAQYDGDWYMMIGAASESRTYVYKNPVASLDDHPELPLVPMQILKTTTPSYVSFSDNARFMMAENGASISVYDAENDRGYKYDLKLPLDSTTGHAIWMDGYRMTVTSGGKLLMFEFDDANQETLQSIGNADEPMFDSGYKYVYGLAPQTTKAEGGKETTQFLLTRTALRTSADL